LNALHSIKGQDVVKRLEQEREAIMQNSFDHYKKEFDLVTGVRKLKFDQVKLHRDENQYVDSIQALVGSRSEPALRMPNLVDSRS